MLAWLALLLVTGCRQSTGRTTPADAALIDLLVGAPTTLAETRQIVFGGGERSHLVEGWSIDEHDPQHSFVWATATEASLSFDLINVAELQVLVSLSSFLTLSPQVVRVLVNDQEVAHFTAEPIFLEYRFVIPARVLRYGRNRLTFHHSALGKPPRAGPESRSLAAAYSWLLIGPNCAPLRGFGLPRQPGVERLQGRPAGLRITGPVIVSRRVVVPSNARLKLRFALPKRAHGAAVSTLRIRDGADVDSVVTRLKRRWPFGPPVRDVDVDLSRWSGKTVEIEIEVAPEGCRSSVAAVELQRAAIVASAGA